MGAPIGNRNAAGEQAKATLWSDAIRRAILAEDGKKLRLLAEKMIAVALEGDVTAMKEIGDRLEGKPRQAIDAILSGILHVTGSDLDEKT